MCPPMIKITHKAIKNSAKALKLTYLDNGAYDGGTDITRLMCAANSDLGSD